ncbi:hypothetical protein NF27_DT01150 [Candidatus Jidaibacter acanthamoeba]|uniref:Glycosyltransferase RgtA/B/C/D-like domain-containing protein n=1 Tax=Candidatus Jidaibacter acanthamoebae TaxID=86105 RepID=A0A0C1MZ79_9RICK|nr:hypothetical protein NF27_DT01150 [Candidatus Jidaibacter acanthamoeba]
MLRKGLKNNSQLAFIILSTVLLVFRLFAIKVNNLELYADEAQYWVWAQHPDFGYYSKPPLVAWLIAFSTKLFGNCEFAIRVFSPFLHFITGFIVYLIGKNFGNKVAFLSGCVYITTPAIFVSSFIMSTDPVLMILWALSFYFFLNALNSNKFIYWVLCGVASGLGMLAKYNMLFFLLSAFLYMFYISKSFRFVYSKNFIAALISALLIFSPNLLWNINNMFVSFMHTADLVQGDPSSKFNFKKLAEFFFAQFGVFGIITFGFLNVSAYLWWRGKLNDNYKILCFFSIPILSFMLIIAFISRAHANWAAPIYITSSVLVVLTAKDLNKLNLIKFSIGLHLVVGLGIMFYQPLCQKFGMKIAPKYDVYKRLRGGEELGRNILRIKGDYDTAIIAVDTRKDLSLINYYTKQSKVEIVKWNPTKRISDYYALTTDANKFIGQDMLVVFQYSDEERRLSDEKYLRNYAEKVKFIEVLDNSTAPSHPKYQIFYLKKFKGY